MKDKECEQVYPANLRLKGKLCAVVGGGQVALRKVRGLLSAGASVKVIAPQVTDELAELAAAQKINWQQSVYKSGMIKDCRLVVCAADVPEVNRQVSEEAKKQGIWVNAPGEPSLSDFWVPAVIRRGNLTLTVSTTGMSPALSKALREKIERKFPKNFGAWLETAAGIRQEMKNRLPDSRAREFFWRTVMTDSMLKLIAEGKFEQAEVELRHAADGFGLKSQDSPGDDTGEVRPKP